MSGHVCHCPIALPVMRFVQTLRSVVLTSSKVEPEACIYESPCLPISGQTPASASFYPRISMDASIETHMEGLQQRDRRQSPPESPSLSDGATVAAEEINRRRREVRIGFLRTSRSSHNSISNPSLAIVACRSFHNLYTRLTGTFSWAAAAENWLLLTLDYVLSTSQ
jgi:hypothetical protein